MCSRGRPEAVCLLVPLALAVLLACDGPTLPGEGPDRLWASLAVGENHACASDVDGNVFCWGSNDRGQLSAPVGELSVGPTLSQIGVGAVSVSAGSGYSCFLTRAGDATCWGEGAVGQLGSGTPFGSAIGERVQGGPWSEISAGTHHSCGLTGSAVRCWGGDRYGASMGTRLPVVARCTIGSGLEMWWCSLDPSPLDQPRDFASVSAGLWHSCAVDPSGDVYCWGQNGLGQLGAATLDECVVIDPVHGDAMFPCNFDPVRVDLPEAVTSVSAGASHTCAIGTSGSVYCWGGTQLYAGQLGHGGDTGSAVPVRVQLAQAIESVSTSRQYIWTATCGLDASGRAFCWGANRSGTLGAVASDSCTPGGGTSCALSPVAVETEERFVEIDVGEEFVCARTQNGRIFCWGRNDVGQLGDGSRVDRQAPMPILPIL